MKESFMKLRRIFALFIFAFALPAIAQQYPTKPVRLLVGYAAGSSTDIAGRARALGVTSRQRYPAAPNVPTIAEQGLSQYEATLWNGFFAPASIPPELAARIARDVEAVLKQPETREMLAKTGAALFEDNQANFKKFFRADIEKWKNLVKATHLKLE
jgi:tripartite-type tricarboxylate transporter receptor subunit TctC